MKLCQCLFLAGISAIAVTHPAIAGLEIDTEKISLSGVAGEAISTSLRITTDEAIQSFSITEGELAVAGGDASISAQDITIDGVPSALAANETITVEIAIPATAIAISGEFQGSLLIQNDGNSQILPMTVQVKQPPHWAWAALLIGAGVGVGLRLYRDYGLPKDEILVPVAKLRTQMKAEDAPTAERFKAAVAGALQAVETDLDNQAWEAARDHLTQGQIIWGRWQNYRPDWIRQIEYLEKSLLTALKADTGAYGRTVNNRLAGVQLKSPTYESPDGLRQALEPLEVQIDRYQTARSLINDFADLTKQLQKTDQSQRFDEKRHVQRQLENQLKALKPEEKKDYDAWLATFKAEYQNLEELVFGQAQSTTTTSDRGVNLALQTSISRLPGLSGLNQKVEPDAVAQRNLTLFRWITPVVTVGIIAWIGMAERYEKEATFGANPIGDYLGLFLWGFGAEVSRDAVVKALGTLKTPLSKPGSEQEAES